MNIIRRIKASGAGRIQIERGKAFSKNIEVDAVIDSETGEIKLFANQNDLQTLAEEEKKKDS